MAAKETLLKPNPSSIIKIKIDFLSISKSNYKLFT